jgi:hypothetical protein
MNRIASRIAHSSLILLAFVNCVQADDESVARATYCATEHSYETAVTTFNYYNTKMNNAQADYHDLSDAALLAHQNHEISDVTYDAIKVDLANINNYLIAVGQILNSANVPPTASIRESKMSAGAHLDNAESYLLVFNWSAVMTECAGCNSDLNAMQSGFDDLAPFWDSIEVTLDDIELKLP